MRNSTPWSTKRRPVAAVYPDTPFPDITVFLLLGRNKSVEVEAASPRRLAQWQRYVERVGCALSVSAGEENHILTLEKADHFHVPNVGVDPNDVHPFLSLAMGLRQQVECIIGQSWSSPLRQALACFGYPCIVKSMNQKKDEDPLLRRLRFMKTGKKSEGPQQFSISVDFTKSPASEALIDLPGNEMLPAHYSREMPDSERELDYRECRP